MVCVPQRIQIFIIDRIEYKWRKSESIEFWMVRLTATTNGSHAVDMTTEVLPRARVLAIVRTVQHAVEQCVQSVRCTPLLICGLLRNFWPMFHTVQAGVWKCVHAFYIINDSNAIPACPESAAKRKDVPWLFMPSGISCSMDARHHKYKINTRYLW